MPNLKVKFANIDGGELETALTRPEYDLARGGCLDLVSLWEYDIA